MDVASKDCCISRKIARHNLLDEIASKTVYKDDDGNRKKRSKAVKADENINTTCQSSLGMSSVQKEVPPSHKMEDNI